MIIFLILGLLFFSYCAYEFGHVQGFKEGYREAELQNGYIDDEES